VQPASRISGTGSAFPRRILTTSSLAGRLGVTEDWILERTGIQTRHISDPKDVSEGIPGLSLVAARKALEAAEKKPSDIDGIILATCTSDAQIPPAACTLQNLLGATHAWGFDLNATCTGFINAVATAGNFINAGAARTVLVVGADVLSASTNWEDKSSCILFGDGAGAVVVEQSATPSRILSSHLGINGAFNGLFIIDHGKMAMKGRELFKISVKTMAEYAELAARENGLTARDLDWIVPHQANLRIIEAVADRLGFPMERTLVNIDRRGNTSAATIPTALDEAVRDGRVKSGQHVLLLGFGAGATFGSILIKW